MIANLGWTPGMIDEVPAQDVWALLAWWREHPLTAETLAAVHRVMPAPPPDPDDPSGIGALLTRDPSFSRLWEKVSPRSGDG